MPFSSKENGAAIASSQIHLQEKCCSGYSAEGTVLSKLLFLTRRRFVSGSLATAAALSVAPELLALVPVSCSKLTPEQEQGPFYVEGELVRSSIAEDKPGIPLLLHITLLDSRTCAPLTNAAIDLWHCDASGLYSGYTKTTLGPPPDGNGRDHQGPPPGPPPDFQRFQGAGPGEGPGRGPGGPPAMKPTDKLTFCRGIQLTGGEGSVTFHTIFPGFYQGRVNHIHLRVHLGGHKEGTHYEAGHISHTGQIFFPEDLAMELMQQEPYRSHKIHRTTIAEDGVYNGQHGVDAMAALIPSTQGYLANITLQVDPTATPKPAGGMGGPPPGF